MYNKIKENYYSIQKACKILFLFLTFVLQNKMFRQTSSCNNKIQDNFLSFYALVTYV